MLLDLANCQVDVVASSYSVVEGEDCCWQRPLAAVATSAAT
jgi:hypothetical protein